MERSSLQHTSIAGDFRPIGMPVQSTERTHQYIFDGIELRKVDDVH